MFFGKTKQTKQSERIPPNQNVTTKFPMLHAGNVPYYEDMSKWNLQVYGLVDRPMLLSFKDIKAFPEAEVKNDIHCVTGWSRLDNIWQGIRAKDIAEKAGVHKEAGFVILHAEEGWTANLPLSDFTRETSLLAYAHNGEPLTPEHGYPLRGVFPHLYFWKSAKWLRGIQFTKENHPGFWEKNGYHMRGDPWKNERFTWD
ncbi:MULTISPECIES: sulfite oxidase-like oxidoreductase [Bacillus amyloliquefaciens group]|uniref:sulfite oxidase-like oxidoreductase n=1 Tax=Bacillus amyloliquefaciens group TaxID=1938374 RepID=UPI0007448397|nr:MULTISPECIES: sulfite oxidase-like oxidoreductase [Bacillus amyloliquefaciens group]AOO62802.1 oxidoreductase [Bacillus velezensis]MCT6831363.1 sulfite oxidase-like oxidoreductase [Bacillus velezensis]MCT6864608.1 sulfite oxidase-like oxidoreductase [Bacillus velezensis]QGT57084.1 molybdopterin-dependent oxidoreductase [Bacillus velezensis]QOX74765.1 sulfite oxidase-like oxidoreductase [Bacillus velezensis]